MITLCFQEKPRYYVEFIVLNYSGLLLLGSSNPDATV